MTYISRPLSVIIYRQTFNICITTLKLGPSHRPGAPQVQEGESLEPPAHPKLLHYRHIDHGKSTMADRWRSTSTIGSRDMKHQILDSWSSNGAGHNYQLVPVRMEYKAKTAGITSLT